MWSLDDSPLFLADDGRKDCLTVGTSTQRTKPAERYAIGCLDSCFTHGEEAIGRFRTLFGGPVAS